MLHHNISAKHKTFGFQSDFGDEFLVKQAVTKSILRPVMLKEAVDAHGMPLENVVADSPEQRNYVLAKNITQHRATLKAMLAEVPLMALWVLNKCGQYVYNEDELGVDGEVNPAEEQVKALGLAYEHAKTVAFKQGLDNAVYLQAKQQLTNLVAEMPLSAEQLKSVATMVTYAYVLQASENPKPTQTDLSIADALLKRMGKLVTINQPKLQNELQSLGLTSKTDATFAAFLLPPDNQLHTSLRHLVRTEELWLGARQKLANANARLVLYLANQYKGGFLEFNDMVQEGQSGLLKAIDRFDYQRGFKFSTYAVYWIRQGISRSLTRNERVVRLPFGQMANIGKVHRAKEVYFAKTGQEAPVSALMAATEMTEAEINHIFYIGQTATSLDAPVGDEEGNTTLVDFMEQQVHEPMVEVLAKNALNSLLNTALAALSDKEAQVICCRFGLHGRTEMTLEDIGRDLNLTRERVRQIQTIALQKLKEYFGADLADFL